MLTPTAHPDGCIYQAQPFNAVPSLSTLRRFFLTPAEFFSPAHPEPESISPGWNFKGYLNTAWPRLAIHTGV